MMVIYFKRKKFGRKPGITLIELIASMALLTIVLTIAYNMELFSNKIFYVGASRSDVQSELRTASNYITKELRYATDVSILSAMPATPDVNREYIYVDGNGVLKHYSFGTLITIPGVADGLTSILQFHDIDTQTIDFYLQGKSKNESDSIDTAVLLLNIGKGSLNNSPGSVITYTSGEPVVTDLNAKPVKTITISAPSTQVQVGGQMTFTSTVSPSDASVQTVTWSIDRDSSIATIDKNTGVLNVVTSLANQKIVVTATANDGYNAAATYTVYTSNTLPVKKLTYFTVASDYAYVFNSGGTLQMRLSNITPADATNQKVTWSLDLPNTTATIGTDGLLAIPSTFNSTATVNVKAMATDGSGVSNTSAIGIIPKITKVLISNTTTSIKQNNSSLQLYCYVNSTGNTAQLSTGISALQWSLSGSVASDINNGQVKISSTGLITTKNATKGNHLTITVTATPIQGNNFTATLPVDITN